MTTANELITRSLRLINFPGRGSSLAPEDVNQCFEALQELLDSKAVSKQMVPGIRRHFYQLSTSKNRYSMGAASGVDLDTSPFGLFYQDPAPIKIESCIIRTGSSITDYEQVDEYRFNNVGTWTLASAAISNRELTLELAVGSATQALGVDLSGLTTYTLRLTAQVYAGQATVALRNNAVAFASYVIDQNGQYEFDVLWPAGTLPDIQISTAAVTDDVAFTLVSLIERGRQRQELADTGVDYVVRAGDQNQYNAVGVKGIGTTWPNFYFYQRNAGTQRTTGAGGPNPSTRLDPIGEIAFDTGPSIGDVLLLDVLVNSIQVYDVNDTLNVTPEAIRWLRYALADNVAAEYGKELSLRQVQIMDEALSNLSAGNRRINALRMPDGLTSARRYSINGDV
jgi:hypothetical protein